MLGKGSVRNFRTIEAVVKNVDFTNLITIEENHTLNFINGVGTINEKIHVAISRHLVV